MLRYVTFLICFLNILSISSLEFGVIQIIYHILTLISFLLALGRKETPAMVLVIFRNILRVFDLENTEEKEFVILIHFIIALAGIRFLFQSRPIEGPLTYISAAVLLSALMSALLYVTYQYYDLTAKIILSLIFITVRLINLHNTNCRLFYQFHLIETYHNQNDMIKIILKKLKMPILILSNSNQIEYANDRFTK